MTKRWAWVLAAGLLVTAVGAQMVGPVSSLWASGALPANAVLLGAGGSAVKASAALTDNGTTLAATEPITSTGSVTSVIMRSHVAATGIGGLFGGTGADFGVYGESAPNLWSLGYSPDQATLTPVFQWNAAGNAALGPIASPAGNFAAGTIQPKAAAFSTLAACAAGTEGTTAAVTDSTTNAWGATVTGAGTFHVLAYCDGTAWTVAAK